ncbi:hypothetical protein FACS1894108_02200 [Planctomycetales bacterium]|nr:hypothetical protein FACS1894108_02200 [Planctomycetales bacterium]
MSASYTPPPEVEQLRRDWENTSPENIEFDDRWLRLAKGAVNAISAYGAAQKWEELEAWGKTLKDVAARFADNADIQLELAKGAVSAIYRYGAAQKREGLEAWGKTLKDVAARFADNADIQLALAKGAVNAILRYGDAQKWEELEAWGKTLQGVAARFAANADIQLRLAKGAVNAISAYGAAQRWEELEAWGKELKGVANDQRFAANAEIQLRLAMGAVNAISRYGAAQKREELEAWVETLRDVAARFAANADIQLALAMGAVNAISRYGAAQKREELEAWVETLRDVAARFAANADIQLALAMGAVSAISAYGAAKKWEELEAWGKELKGVANDQRFAANAEIQLRLAMGAVNAISRYGAAQKREELEAWVETLRDVAARFAANADIQLALARGAVSAISAYGAAKKWEELEAWGKTLRGVAARFADHADIQLALAKGAVNAILYYGDAQKWEELEAWGKTLQDVANSPHFANNADIQLALAVGAVNAMIPYRKTGKSKNMKEWGETKEWEKWNQWGKELLKIIKTKDQIPSRFSRADEKEFFRFANKWEWDDDFCGLLNNDEKGIANKELRALWEYQEDVVELLRVEFSDTSKEENGAVYQVAHYLSVRDFDRMIQVKDEKKPPAPLQLKSVSSANDPMEGKTFQRFLLAGDGDAKQKLTPQEMMIAMQVSFTRCIDSLNQFRLYGMNDAKSPGTGLCLVFDKNFFADESSKSSFINKMLPQNNTNLHVDRESETDASSKRSFINEMLPRDKTTLHVDGESKYTDEAGYKIPLYWVLYYDDSNPDKPFFIHTPTQCALRVDGNTYTKEYQKKYSWASERNTAIFNALQAVRTKYLAIIKGANDDIERAISERDEIERSKIKNAIERLKIKNAAEERKTAAEERKKAAWHLLIYLRHLVKDAAFAEEQEMRMLMLCEFGDEKIKTLNTEKNLLGIPYFRILHQEHCVKKVIAGPKVENFTALETRWRNEIKQYEKYLRNSKKNTKKLSPPNESFDVKFSQSKAPLA